MAYKAQQPYRHWSWPWVALVSLGAIAMPAEPGWGVEPPPRRDREIFQWLLTVPSVYDNPARSDGNGSGAGNSPQAVEQQVTARTPDLEGPSLPSLWWHRNQILPQWGGGRLVQDWVAFKVVASEEEPENPASAVGVKGARVVDVQVDRQYWERLVPRRQRHPGAQFALLNQWGTAASSYGYNLRLYLGDRLTGIYSCDFDHHPLLSQSPSVEVPADQLMNLPCFAELGPFTPRRILQ